MLTLDGPSGAGKGTVAQGLAAELGWHYLDSGALYRTVGLLARRAGVDLQDIGGLVKLARALEVRFARGSVLCAGENVDREIRTEAAAARASRIAKLPAVRAELLKWQRSCARPPGLVAEGRDMGTVVFPQAACKIFLTADISARAARRFKQLRARGLDANMRQLGDEIAARDRRDLHRAASPLQPAADAFELDTTELSIDEAIAAARARLKQCAARSK